MNDINQKSSTVATHVLVITGSNILQAEHILRNTSASFRLRIVVVKSHIPVRYHHASHSDRVNYTPQAKILQSLFIVREALKQFTA